jgi:hypothetical protein
VIFRKGDRELTKRILSIETVQKRANTKSIRLPRRSEVIVRLQVEEGIEGTEGLIKKTEITDGVYLASSLTRIEDHQAITSILNTRETDIVIDIPAVKWEKFRLENSGEDQPSYIGAVTPVEGKGRPNRENEVIRNLRLDHLNSEEIAVMESREYQDICHLPGDKLSCTSAVKHSINTVPGTNPINTRPYRLPEAQKAEVDRQVTKLLKEGIIEGSNSPWNSPLLIVPKKEDASGEKKWRLVVDFRKLNYKTVGEAYPLPDITDIGSTRTVKVFQLFGYGNGLLSNRIKRGVQGQNRFQHKKWALGIHKASFRSEDSPIDVSAVM